MDYPSAKSVTQIVQEYTSNEFEWLWTIYAVSKYLDPLIYIDEKDISTHDGLNYITNINADPNFKSHTIIGLKIHNLKKLGIGQHEIYIWLRLSKDVDNVNSYNNHPNVTVPLIINIQGFYQQFSILMYSLFVGTGSLILWQILLMVLVPVVVIVIVLILLMVVCITWHYCHSHRRKGYVKIQ